MAVLGYLLSTDFDNKLVFYAIQVTIVVGFIVSARIWNYWAKHDEKQKMEHTKELTKVYNEHTESLKRNTELKEEIYAQQMKMIEQQKKAIDKEEDRFETVIGLRGGIEEIMRLASANNQRVEYAIEIVNKNSQETKKMLSGFDNRLNEIESKVEKIPNLEIRVTKIEQQMKKR